MDFVETALMKTPDITEWPSDLEEFSIASPNKGIIVEVAAIHAGLTENYNHYSADALRNSLDSWTDPYPKPVILNHDLETEPIGRVMDARMAQEEDGTEYVSLQVVVTAPDAVEKILDGRYLTGSVGGKAMEARCSVCGEDWSQASLFNVPCEHRKGKTYDGKLAYIDIGRVGFREYSIVNAPADAHSGVRSVTPAVTQPRESTPTVAVQEFDVQAQQLMSLSESVAPSPVADPRIGDGEIADLFKEAYDLASIFDEEDKKKPYGDVTYADPGYQPDGVKRYPVNSADRVRSAWSYINMPRNARKYTPAQLKRIKNRIKRAAKEFGVDIDKDESTQDVNATPEQQDDDVLSAVEDLQGTSVHAASQEQDSNDAQELDVSEMEYALTVSDQETDGTYIVVDRVTFSEADFTVSVHRVENDESGDRIGRGETYQPGDDVVDAQISLDEPMEQGGTVQVDLHYAPNGEVGDHVLDADGEPVKERFTLSVVPQPAEESDGESAEQETPEADEAAESDASDDQPEVEAEESDGEGEEPVAEEAAPEVEPAEESAEAEEAEVTESESELQATIDRLEAENTKLRGVVKRMLAERVVDAKVAVGLVGSETYEEQVSEHLNRSASSLADSLKDLAQMSPASKGHQHVASVPPQEGGPAPLESSDENAVTVEGEDLDQVDESEKEDTSLDPVEGLSMLMRPRTYGDLLAAQRSQSNKTAG